MSWVGPQDLVWKGVNNIKLCHVTPLKPFSGVSLSSGRHWMKVIHCPVHKSGKSRSQTIITSLSILSFPGLMALAHILIHFPKFVNIFVTSRDLWEIESRLSFRKSVQAWTWNFFQTPRRMFVMTYFAKMSRPTKVELNCYNLHALTKCTNTNLDQSINTLRTVQRSIGIWF